MKQHIDNFFGALTDLVPAKYRKVVHEGLTLALALVTVWLAAEQNWGAFLTLLGTAYTASNASNTFETGAGSEFEAFDEHDEHDGLVEVSYDDEKDPEAI